MTGRGSVDEGEQVDPTAAFKAIGNETRLAILRELLKTKGRPVTFTDLRKRVGMRDSSQFNYHLQKLEPGFVERTDDGFRINRAGANVVLAIVAGTFTEHPTIPPFEVEGECVHCGGVLLARYWVEMVYINCADCERLHYMTMFPPGGLIDRTPAEVVTASERRLRLSYQLSMTGVCPGCAGRNHRTVLGHSDTYPRSVWRFKIPPGDVVHPGPAVLYECEQCYVWALLTMGATLLFEPVVVEFFRDHGRDLNEMPLWTLPWCVPAASHEYSTILSEDPLRVEVRVPLEDETLLVTIDGDLEVVEAERIAGVSPPTTGDMSEIQ